MALYRKGESGNPNGRPKGATNKSTEKIKEAYTMLVEHNLDNITDWISEIAKDNPEKALDLLIKLTEYVIPKLARSEVNAEIQTKLSPIAEEIKKLREKK